jgi:hypothetical protein
MDHSPLRKLSAELRMRIYELIILPTVVNVPNPPKDTDAHTLQSVLGLLKACRQIHQETMPLFCSRIRFVFHVRNDVDRLYGLKDTHNFTTSESKWHLGFIDDFLQTIGKDNALIIDRLVLDLGEASRYYRAEHHYNYDCAIALRAHRPLTGALSARCE